MSIVLENNNKTYLITGGSGFIGIHLRNAVKESGFNMHLLLRKRIEGLDCKQYCFDLESGLIDNEAFIGVDTIFHLAGHAHDLSDKNNFKKYQKINVDLTMKFAELAFANNVKNFVFLSSVKAGGNHNFKNCASEAEQEEPRDFYGKSKRVAELKLLQFAKDKNLRVTIIRSSLVYGPGVKGNLEKMLSAINKGWMPPLPETGNKRSMIHVDNLVRAILFVADIDNANREIFIATDGQNYSTREIYEAMCKVLGKPIPKWALPKFLFKLASLFSRKIKFNVDKLLCNECYSSKKLESRGFKPYRSLEEMNETIF